MLKDTVRQSQTMVNDEKIVVWSFNDAVWKSDLDTTAKLVLLAIERYANNQTQSCFPTVRTLAKDASCSSRTVFRKFNELKEAGFLEIEPRYKGNEQISSVYWLSLPDKYVLKMRRIGVEIHNNPMTQSHNPMTQSQGGGDTVSHRTYTLTSKNKDNPYNPLKRGQVEEGGRSTTSLRSVPPSSPSRKSLERKDAIELRQSKQVTPELLAYGHEVFKENHLRAEDDEVRKLFKDCMVWCEENNKLPMNPKTRFKNWIQNQIDWGKTKATTVKKAQTFEDLTPEQQERWRKAVEAERKWRRGEV